MTLTLPVRTGTMVREPWLVVVARNSVAIALAVIFLVPFLFVFLISFMTSDQALTSNLWPTTWHPGELRRASSRSCRCSTTWSTRSSTSVLATGFMLLSSVPAAYALAKLRWRGENAVFVVIICMMMLPPQVVTVPLYLMWSNAGLTGTLWPLILPMLAGRRVLHLPSAPVPDDDPGHQCWTRHGSTAARNGRCCCGS